MKRKGLLTAIGCSAVFAAVLFGGAWLLFWLYDSMFGADTAYAVENTPWLICAAIPALCFVVLMAYEVKALLGSGEGGLDSMQMMGVTAVLLMLLLAAHFMAGLCVEQVDEDGVSKYVLRKGIHYSWADVDYYTIEEKSGEVRVTLVMESGTEFCYGNGWFGISSDAFMEKFPDDTYDFWPYAAVEMKKQGVTAEADWEQLEAQITDEAGLELIRELKKINETAYYL